MLNTRGRRVPQLHQSKFKCSIDAHRLTRYSRRTGDCRCHNQCLASCLHPRRSPHRAHFPVVRSEELIQSESWIVVNMSTSTVDTRSRSSSSVPSTPSSTTTDATDNTPIIRTFFICSSLPCQSLTIRTSLLHITAPAAPLDSHAAPNKAEFLAIQSGLKRRPAPSTSASLHTSTYSVATTATAGGEGTDDGISEDGNPASLFRFEWR